MSRATPYGAGPRTGAGPGARRVRRDRRGIRLAVFARMVRGSLFARRDRLLLAVAAIAIGTSVAAALLLVSLDVGRKVGRELRAFGPNLVLAPAAGDLAVGARDLRLGGVGGVPRFGEATRAWLAGEHAAGRLLAVTPVRYAIAREGDRSFVVLGVDLSALRELYPSWRVEGPTVTGGPARPIRALLGDRAARALGVTPGGSVILELPSGTASRPLALEEVAVIDAGGAEGGEIFVEGSLLDGALAA